MSLLEEEGEENGVWGRLIKPEVENRLVGEDGYLKELLLLKFGP